MTKRRGIASLTGIRGLAALWVLSYHVSIVIPGLQQRFPSLSNGWHAVDLFFMLSGFILMYTHERDFHTIRKPALLRFAQLRFMRVYPLNAAVLLLIVPLVIFDPAYVACARSMQANASFGVLPFLRTLFVANRWFLPGFGDWNEPVWSLSVEILGYVLFPLLAYCAWRMRRGTHLVTSIVILLGGFACFMHLGHQAHVNVIGQGAFFRMLVCFASGMLTYRLWAVTQHASAKRGGWIAACAMAGILCADIIPRADILFNLLFAILLYGLAFQHGVVNRALSSRAALFFGRVSFPLYLTHAVMLLWATSILREHAGLSAWAQATLLGSAVAGSILLATLLHYAVERPAHALGRRWSEHSERQRGFRSAQAPSTTTA